MNELWLLGFGAAVAGLVQGISGFAFSMVAMSIWVWGLDPLLAAPMAVFGGWFGQCVSAIRVRRGFNWPLLWPFVVGSAIGIPLGTQVLGLLDPNRFKLVLGSLLVICCSMMLATAQLPKVTRGGKMADAFVGLLGGVMAPLSGFSGLAPALWATLRGYNKDEHRAVLQNFNLLVLSATLATNVYAGRVRPDMWPQMAVVAGVMILPAVWGSKIYVGMSATAFRNTVLWLLVLAGVVMLTSSLRTLL
ncbi:MAG TPA: sulfite exporter TauE/SafE family protein [Vicinamibacterales bacterium]|nr:sulfite exporter TauE/SafE family protein [Vicinamibacterales bacterium]